MAALSQSRSRTQPRHEPGKYFADMVPGAHTHLKTGTFTEVVVTAAVSDTNGVNVTVLPSIKGSLVPRAWTVTTPTLFVLTDITYLVGALAAVSVIFCSQPHSLAAGLVVLELDWITSVMVVRHAEPARTTSVTLARLV